MFGRLRRVFNRRGRAAVAVRGDLGEHGADGDRLALGGEDLHERAGCGRGNLGVDLVRGHLDERLVGLDGLAFLLVPPQNGAFTDGFAHRGECHLNCRVHGHARAPL